MTYPARTKKQIVVSLAALVGLGGTLWIGTLWVRSQHSNEANDALLAEAVYHSDTKTVAASLQKGADPNVLATLPGREIRLKVLYDVSDRFPALRKAITPFDRPQRESLLWLAAERGQPKIARLLLLHGAKPDTAGNDGDTALMMAGHQGNAGLVKMLLAAGAKVNYRSEAGETPLARTLDGPTYLRHHRGGANYHAEALRLLIAAGANINTQTADGETPLHTAQTNHQRALAAILSNAGAK